MSSRIFSRIPFSIITFALLVVVGCVALSGKHGPPLTQTNHIMLAGGKEEKVYFAKPFASEPEVTIDQHLLYEVKIVECKPDHFTVRNDSAGQVNIFWTAKGEAVAPATTK